MNFKKLSKLEIKKILKKLKKNQKMICKKCGNALKKSKQKELLGICSFKYCKSKNYKWANTIFQNLKISKSKCLQLLELWMNNEKSKTISYNLNINKKTVSNVLKKLENILVPSYYSKCSKIGGNNIVVEIDESKFGKRKYHRGHKVEGTWIFGMVERSDKRKIHLVVVENRNSTTLTKILVENVEKNSIIYSDSWKGYKNLKNHFLDHLKVNHSLNYKDPITMVHTNTIEGNWSGSKINIPFKKRSKEDIKVYLVRYMILRNNSTDHPLLALLHYLFEF